MSNYLYTGKDWNSDTIDRIYDEVCKIGEEELKLDWYNNIFQICNYDQMLDLYASHGMPVMYDHWSYGKSYLQNHQMYQKGYMGLALEMVINTNPCINYLLDENTATGQALVIAHAAIGHNSFFKNNYLFKQWTSADFILDYLVFARDYIQKCEDKYGRDAVEYILDRAHSLQFNGVDRYHKPKVLSAAEEEKKVKAREEEEERSVDEIWNLIPNKGKAVGGSKNPFLPQGPEENLLYFLEKKSPILKGWQREILRIVRKINQYFYPAMHTKTINEGWASTCHYYIMNRLYDKGLLDEGAMLEFHQLHTSVVFQPEYTDKRYSGFNPYHLGFSIFADVKRMSMNPTEEDKEWHPDIAGGDWVENWKYIYENFRDDSLIHQFLSPELIRKLKLFTVTDDWSDLNYVIPNIHNERGYREIRKVLANSKSFSSMIPDIQVTSVDFNTRECFLTHYSDNLMTLEETTATKVIDNFTDLWGFDVVLTTKDRNSLTTLDLLGSALESG